MIDVVFQLIAFFMVLINFSEVEVAENILLPSSTLAKTPEKSEDFRILLNLQLDKETLKPSVYFVGNEYAIKSSDQSRALPPISNELRVKTDEAIDQEIEKDKIVVIIRAHTDAHMASVQHLIAECQEFGLQNFAFRVKSEIPR